MTTLENPWGYGSLAEPLSGRHWAPAEIQRQVALREAAFAASGVEPGDRVLIHFGNCLEFFAELLAAWRVGACAIPVDARLTAFEVEKLAGAARARFNVINDDTPQTTSAALGGAALRHTHDLDPALGRRRGGQAQSAWPRLDDDALILFTSGSTGEPKGVVHTHRSLLARWSALRENLGLEAYRRTLCLLPTHFGHGLICNSLYPWLSGCDLLIVPPFKPELVMQLGSLIDEHGVSFMSSVPSVWNLALKTARPPRAGSLRRVHVGSAPLSAGTWLQVQQWTGTREVFNAYGITETGSWVAGTTGEEIVPESGLIGRPWGAVIRVLDNSGEHGDQPLGRLCEPGETGMVWLHTPALMKGYFQRQDLTDAAVQGGWFKTGDIGLLDQRGRLFLKGRERDEINKGGLKIFPADIDEIVERYPATRDVCTFGFEDGFYGENVGLAVVLEGRDDETVAGLHDWLCLHLAEHKHPVRWYVVDEIPRTSRGKINRESVRQDCMEREPLDLRRLLRRSEGDKA
jgi:acyl-CoA synthetase (AMP-forming)/AMP-acid ligase II